MKQIAAVIPTLGRADKLPAFIQNHDSTSTNSTLYFVISMDDTKSKEVLERFKQNYFICGSPYVGCINYGFEFTQEPFVLCAADDVYFTPGWDEKLLKLAEDPDKHIFGGIDEWVISQTQKHISHPLVRRTHFKPPLYHPEYLHYMCDIEFVQRGFKEGCVSITPQILIEHPHTVTEHLNKEEWDSTYKDCFAKIDFDKCLYDHRKAQFEMWNFDDLQYGRVTPTKLNPLYAETLVSIVIPSYNDADFLMKCLKSVSANTFYRYEIIIINNGSDAIQKTAHAWELIDTQQLFNSLQLEDKSCEIKVINHEKNLWTNVAWNEGAAEAKGDYVVIINSDITVSRDWDKYLVSALENPSRKFTIACPYETNPHTKVPFALDKTLLKYVPNMLKGPCFMFRKSDVSGLFPIPSDMKHWCGDNWLADRAAAMGGTVFARKAEIFHWISQSSNRIRSSVLLNREYKDILAYERLSKKNMQFIKAQFPEVIRNYCLEDGHESSDPQSSCSSSQTPQP